MWGWIATTLFVIGLALIGFGMKIVHGQGPADQRLGGAIPVMLGVFCLLAVLLIIVVSSIAALF